MRKTKLFTTGGSQAVRLPATGDVVISKPIVSWDEYFDWVRALDLPSDFLRERDQPEDDFRDPYAGAQARVNSCSTLRSPLA
jgi:virulence-associated protein VagC